MLYSGGCCPYHPSTGSGQACRTMNGRLFDKLRANGGFVLRLERAGLRRAQARSLDKLRANGGVVLHLERAGLRRAQARPFDKLRANGGFVLHLKRAALRQAQDRLVEPRTGGPSTGSGQACRTKNGRPFDKLRANGGFVLHQEWAALRQAQGERGIRVAPRMGGPSAGLSNLERAALRQAQGEREQSGRGFKTQDEKGLSRPNRGYKYGTVCQILISGTRDKRVANAKSRWSRGGRRMDHVLNRAARSAAPGGRRDAFDIGLHVNQGRPARSQRLLQRALNL